VTELLDSVGSIAIYVALIAVLAWALYFAFGPQALGLPAMIGVLAIFAGASVVGNVGLAGIVVIALALAAVVVVFGMAMNVGEKRARRPGDEPRD
jgi:uncharacterized membrane protein HdeD (DUF308 family)